MYYLNFFVIVFACCKMNAFFPEFMFVSDIISNIIHCIWNSICKISHKIDSVILFHYVHLIRRARKKLDYVYTFVCNSKSKACFFAHSTNIFLCVSQKMALIAINNQCWLKFGTKLPCKHIGINNKLESKYRNWLQSIITLSPFLDRFTLLFSMFSILMNDCNQQ